MKSKADDFSHHDLRRGPSQRRPPTSCRSDSSAAAAAADDSRLWPRLRGHLFTLALVAITTVVSNRLYFHFYERTPAPTLARPLAQPDLEAAFFDQFASRQFEAASFDHVAFATIDGGGGGGGTGDVVLTSPTAAAEQERLGQGIRKLQDRIRRQRSDNKKLESQMALKLAVNMLKEGKLEKAAKIYRYALALDPQNSDALASYGEFLEFHKKDVVRAEHLYTLALRHQPEHDKASANHKRALPLVAKIDREMLDRLDSLLKDFYAIPSTSAALRRAKREAYFMHIYHSNAIEGNTLNLQQTRHIVENRMAVGGKSLLEHQEVLGLDAAMRYLNETLLYRPMGQFRLTDLLEIHRRVLGFCDPIESGQLRKHQVYVGSFVPPPPDQVPALMRDFIDWLNSKELVAMTHPVQAAALAHYKFVYIHPFYDGNGRTARLLMNLLLMKAGYPPVIIRKQERLEYYEHLELANQGDIKPFIRFIARCTQRTLREYIRLCSAGAEHGIDFDTNELSLWDEDVGDSESWRLDDVDDPDSVVINDNDDDDDVNYRIVEPAS